MFKEAAEVGSRLRYMRESEGLSQWEVASELQISRERLANYEDGRTPLKVEIGLLACYRFIYSEKWLANGEGDPRLLMSLVCETMPAEVKSGTFYATAYKQHLSALYEEFSAQRRRVCLPAFGHDPKLETRVLNSFVLEWYRLLRTEKIEELMQYLLYTGEEFCTKNIHPDDLSDPGLLQLSDVRDSTAFVPSAIIKAHAAAVAKKQKRGSHP